MKKFIKISLLILFIIFVLGITTSKAALLDVDVEDNTDADDIISHLSVKGNSVTGIDDNFRDRKDGLYCREEYVYLYNDAVYTFEFDEKGNPVKYTYPGTDINGYAKSYILAALGYDKSDGTPGHPTKEDERQYAWYCITEIKSLDELSEEEKKESIKIYNELYDPDITKLTKESLNKLMLEKKDGNDLYDIAVAYQKHKKQEETLKEANDGKTIRIVKDTETTIVDGDKIIYGPIQVEYLYNKHEGSSKSDEWGGFNYAFFDGNNTNISSKVSLAKKINGKYETIKSTLEANNYYRVRTDEYSKMDLYIVINDSSISSVKMQMQSNSVDYTATVYPLNGTLNVDSDGINYCGVCWSKLVANEEAAIGNKEVYIQRNGVFYKYETLYGKYLKERETSVYGLYEYVGDKQTEYAVGKSISVQKYSGRYFCNTCYQEFWNFEAKEKHQKNNDSHIVMEYWYAPGYYTRFSAHKGCGRTVYGGKLPWVCGSPYTKGTKNSQGLFIVEAADKEISTNIDLEIDIELSVSIKVTKRWKDNNEVQKPIPSDDIKLKVYRSIDKTNWTELKEGTDYTIVWSDKEGDTWIAYIKGLERRASNGNDYYYKVVEAEVPVDYIVTYSSGEHKDGTVTGATQAITITNTRIKEISIEVTKKWEDTYDLLKVRPGDIALKVYRRTDNTNWTELNGTDYNISSWTKKDTENKWTITIKNLKEQDNNGNKYYFKVEENPDTKVNPFLLNYQVSYSSGNKTNGEVEGNKITITNRLKTTSIEAIKEWDDKDNQYNTRLRGPIDLIVYRSIDKENWYPVDGSYIKLEWQEVDNNRDKVIISGLLIADKNGNKYHYKIEEVTELEAYEPSYPNGQVIENPSQNSNKSITIKNTYKKIEISGYVWLDEQTGVKPALPYNGIKNDDEKKLANIPVYLYYKDPVEKTFSIIKETVTNETGEYKFTEIPVGTYYVEFEYDGINYEDTLENGDSKAHEIGRLNFNRKFNTISYGGKSVDGKVFGIASDGTTLEYNNSETDRKSTLITSENGTVKDKFIMKAVTNEIKYTENVDDLNLGLVKRGADLALSTDLFDAKVTINGQETTYEYNKQNNNITIGTAQSSESENGEVSYSLSLYESDYNYRIRDYVSNNEFKEKNYTGQTVPKDTETGKYLIQTGAQLEFYVTYKLNLQNQSGSGRDVDTGEDIITTINEVTYNYDAKYTFNEDKTKELNAITFTDDENILTVKNVTLGPWETKTIYLVFNVKDEFIGSEEKFTNKAEITSYSTSKGLIDVDSQPGNFVNANQIEDDNDTAGGLGITWSEKERTITGKVFDGSNNVNDVIVQLIELKEITKEDETKAVYEYIWQETVSGTGTGKRLTADGKALETYTYTKSDGHYKFKGFIPGDYIVRFIYGDGTTYDMTDNVIKYNGQDYKSVADENYKAEWYNSSSYSAGASVARDNEARRLETMVYSVDINPVKGLLLKLLNNPTVDNLNKTEKEILVLTYNTLYDPDISEIKAEHITKLLKEQVLKNTWMCAETSKIKVAVDTEDITNTNATTTVNGSGTSYVNNISDINLGLELRPATKIELKKYITGFKLVASNGQTLVNAHVDVNEYLNGTMDSNKVQGIKDHVTILDNLWQYEVIPTDINTIIDGANLEFEYTLVVKNTGDNDYLSTELADAYANNSVADYKTILNTRASEIKTSMRNGTYRTQIGNSVGSSYYMGGEGSRKVLTEVTNIRDYVNNDLTFVFSYEGKVAVDENASKTHRILRDDYSMQETTLTTVLKTTESTGKMSNTDSAVMYTVNLGKNPISSTGNLEFDTYIAEVMSYTNAAGRRSITSTPGNAEIIDAEKRDGKTHEIDEADTGRIQIGVATGEDQKTNYIIITTIVAGIALIAAGAFVVKKYVIK